MTITFKANTKQKYLNYLSKTFGLVFLKALVCNWFSVSACSEFAYQICYQEVFILKASAGNSSSNDYDDDDDGDEVIAK